MTKHIPWPEIENFHSLRRSLVKHPHFLGELAGKEITYVPKVKLHGTNAGIRIDPDGTVTAFSRSTVITSQTDNMGFARWVEEHRDQWATLSKTKTCSTVVFGEWCGPGIMKGVAVNKMKNRMFAVFAVLDVVAQPDGTEEVTAFEANSVHIENLLNSVKLPDGQLSIIPFDRSLLVSINPLQTPEELEETLEKITQAVMKVESCDPFVKDLCGEEGIGEGLVYYPITTSPEFTPFQMFKNFCFKAKGEKHQVVARTKPAQAEATVVEGLDEFVSLVLTEPRLEQGVRAVFGGELQFDMKRIGQFLAWIGRDLKKEVEAELAASGLDEKVAMSACSGAAKKWYLERFRSV